ncbi:hypothetical protein VTK26DRAFT_4780 [Humicola hyalothermophila]
MLSNPPSHTSGLHSRQRQHRRQNSTPSAFEAVKIAPLPSGFQQQRSQHVSHRRGLSLDTRRQQPAPKTASSTPRQSCASVNIPAANPGSATAAQPALREAQQQRAARHDQSQSTFPDVPVHQQQDDSDSFLLSPQVTPQSQRFMNALSDQGHMTDMSGISFESYLALDMMKTPTGFESSNAIDPSRDFDFFGPDSALSTPTFMTFPDSSPASTGHGWISETETASTQSRRTSRRISNGIMDKFAKFEALGSGVDTPFQRPTTPSSQSVDGRFPQTPLETPSIKQEPATLQPPLNRFSDGYDESMEETLKPVRPNRNSGIFQELRQQSEAMFQTPPRANTIPAGFQSQGLTTPEFMNMSNISAEFMAIEDGFEGMQRTLRANPSTLKLRESSLALQNAFENKPDLQPFPELDSHKIVALSGGRSPVSKTPSRRSSPHRRADSIASLTSAASIADINIEETKTDTGVTLDDIAAFIQGPDPSDGKWICTYENCQKRFGRKENIKSHVQTHLNDRQYQCPTCKKCFVRQHDLKRHAKIHTGIKPYPCECGNSFARHDALTRHRQRGMCIGAFDGIVRKVVKRGRPKKIRPDMDERREKADRTRRKNKATSTSSVSSQQSVYSDSSAANSPGNEFDGLVDDDQFPGLMDVAIAANAIPGSGATMNPASMSVSSAPMPTISGSMAEVFASIPSLSHAPSPSAMSSHSHVSHASSQLSTMPGHGGDNNNNNNNNNSSSSSSSSNNDDAAGNDRSPRGDDPTTTTTTTTTATGESQHGGCGGCVGSPPSPAKSVASHSTHVPGTPPELSSTSSPPPTGTSARFFELGAGDPNGSGLSDSSSIALGTTAVAAGYGASMSAGSSCIAPGLVGGGGGGGSVGMESDILFQFGDLDQGMMLGAKFDAKFEEDYEAMFNGGEDVFFGTS